MDVLVTHVAHFRHKFDEDHAEMLYVTLVFYQMGSRICYTKSDYRLAASSDGSSREQIVEVLRRTGLLFVAENLHRDWCTLRGVNPTRYAEIKSWLKARGPHGAPSILILDDAISGASLRGTRLARRTVFCETCTGFTETELKAAQDILRGRHSHD